MIRIKKTALWIALLLASSLFLAACNENASQGGAAPADPPAGCLAGLQHRELKKPYKPASGADPTRYVLSDDELHTTLSVMGVEKLCIPPALGAPFINIDWNNTTLPGTTGRMLSLGFEGLYHGQGWSDGFIVYAAYNFRAGSEYDLFAAPEDWAALQQGALPDMLEANGTRGFVRYTSSKWCMGQCSAYKTVVFPFETYAVTVVHRLGTYDANADWEQIFKDLKAGYPAERQAEGAAMDALVGSMVIRP